MRDEKFYFKHNFSIQIIQTYTFNFVFIMVPHTEQLSRKYGTLIYNNQTKDDIENNLPTF